MPSGTAGRRTSMTPCNRGARCILFEAESREPVTGLGGDNHSGPAGGIVFRSLQITINGDFALNACSVTLRWSIKKTMNMKPAFKILLLAIAYLLTFILGASSGIIHPACYAYAGAVLPLLTAFIYLLTCATVRCFGAATILNGFVFVLFILLRKMARLRRTEHCRLIFRVLRPIPAVR